MSTTGPTEIGGFRAKNYGQWGKLRTGCHTGHGEGIGVDAEISGLISG
jgi:hypothetical protein